MLLFALAACRSVPPSWDLFASVGDDCPPAAPAAPSAEFLEARKLDAIKDDPLNAADDPDAVHAKKTETKTDPAAPTAPSPVAAAPAMPAPTGLPSQPAWGVRLLQVAPTAQPPRASIGLPDGREIVISPGSMLPEVGMILVAVSPGAAQLARVSAKGDHAEIETITLTAQYP